MFFFFLADKLQKKRINGEGKSLKTMSVSAIATFEIQKLQPNQRTASAGANVLLEADLSLQKNEEDIVALNFASEQSLSQPHSESQIEDGQTAQEISSVAQAASTFSQVVEGSLNDDELAAIQKLAAKIEPIAKEFLSSDPEKFDIEKAVDIALPDAALVETEAPDFDIENIRELPTLVSATIDAGFEKQFQALNETSRDLIVNSLSELMRFFREKVVQVLEPLRDPNFLKQSADQVPVRVDLTEQPQA